MQLSTRFITRCWLGLGLALCTGASAQQLPVMNHYLFNPYLYNPARTGQNETGSVNINFKKQWVSLPNSPLTGSLSMETPLPYRNMGIGGMIYSDRMHIINKLGGMLTYAYHVPFSKDFTHGLSGGLSLGFINQRFDFAAATVSNPNDNQIVPNAANGTAFDFSLGLDYRWKSLHLGFSMLQGLNNQMRFLTNFRNEIKYVNTRHFLGTASYRFELGEEGNKRFYIEPVALLRIVKGLPVQAEVNVLAGWKGLLWWGLGYRSSNNETSTSAMTATFGLDLQRQLFLGYTFEFAVDRNLNSSLGTQHEVMLAYRFRPNNKAKEAERKKEMQQLQEQLQQLQTNDAQRAQELQATQRKADSLAKVQQQLNDRQNKADERINQHDQQIKDQGSRLDAHDKALEEMRKQIEEGSSKFKKMGDILFGDAKTALDAQAKAQLSEVKKMYDQQKRPVSIYLMGHASKAGNAQYNYQLSVERASNVKQYLVSQGVPADKIVMLPTGSKMIDSPNKDAAGDRRVDIFFAQD